jgi:hypothetical protein
MTLSKWVWWAGATLAFLLITEVNNIFGSVGDMDFFGPPGSGSIRWSEVWIRIRILPFSHKGVERTKIMLAK